MSSVRVILNTTKTARYAFNVLAGALEQHVADSRLTLVVARNAQHTQELLEQAAQETLDLVLWSFYSPQFKAACRQLKTMSGAAAPHAVIHLAGGVHASAEPEQTLEAGFDAVAVGEGEQIIVDAVKALLAGHSLSGVQGIAMRGDEKFVRNGRGPLIDLNQFPPFAPRHHLFGAQEITRGCVYACKFCQTPYVSKARFRHRSVENIAHYARLMRAHGFRDYRFISPTSLSYGAVGDEVNIEALGHLLASVRAAVGSQSRVFFGTFPSEVRPEHIDRRVLQLLKRYVDNNNLIIGGQSGSQAVLDASRRGHSVEAVSNAVRLCVEEGFQPNVDLLFGLPGETPEDVRQTMSFAQTLTDLGAKLHTHTFMPLPGTPFRSAAAGDVDGVTRAVIERWESDGKAYGNWKGQIQTARELTALRDGEQ